MSTSRSAPFEAMSLRGSLGSSRFPDKPRAEDPVFGETHIPVTLLPRHFLG